MGISPTQLIIIAVIVLLLFGTKKLRNIGGDLGSAIKGFKKAMNEEKDETNNEPAEPLVKSVEAKSQLNSDISKSENTESKNQDKV